jgi:hypothetical protein
VRLEGLGKLKKKINRIRTRNHDLPACSMVPQQTSLPRAPYSLSRNEIYRPATFRMPSLFSPSDKGNGASLWGQLDKIIPYL